MLDFLARYMITFLVLPILLAIVAALNSCFLIAIFVVRKNPASPLLRKLGKLYLGSFIPAGIATMAAAVAWRAEPAYPFFLAVFIGYLALELCFDFVLKVDFRSDWRLLVPYLVLYYIYNYGFFVLPWKHDVTIGIVLLALFIVQIVTNAITH